MEVFIYSLEISAIGITVVFLALVVIAFILGLFPIIDSFFNKAATQPQQAAQPSPQATTISQMGKPLFDGDDELTPELIVAISAAVSTVIDQKFRIKAVRYRRTPLQPNWAMQGRATMMASHAIKPQPK